MTKKARDYALQRRLAGHHRGQLEGGDLRRAEPGDA
jgi:hypothetical protein